MQVLQVFLLCLLSIKLMPKTRNPEKIKEQLSNMKYLVEDWGGQYKSQESSAKQGINIDKLFRKSNA